jgi:heat shock protein HslJ
MRKLIGISIATALLAVLIATAAAAADGPTATASATSCQLSTHDQRHLGASYVTSLKVEGTTCAKGKGVTLAFNNCRTAGGKPQGVCNRKVGSYTCTEKRYDAVPGVQYSSKVTCTWGAKKVLSTYTQNT